MSEQPPIECACGWSCRPFDPEIIAEALEAHRRHAHPKEHP
jgi:hypothetical protein